LSADVASAESVRGLFERTHERLGGLDILVTAAGVALTAPLTRTDDATWHTVIETNLSGTFRCVRAALPAMTQQGFGRVVVVASIAGKTGARYIAAYAASKHGVLGLMRCAALEAAEQGVTVNAVCPGYVDTPMTDAAVRDVAAKTGKSPEDVRRLLAEQSPQKRLVTADEVAALTAFLCTSEAGGINGQALNVDGGTLL
jgi:NAD(P)-dependent dehydrogenase (short-subunit alcohol dehydrogenase family)